MEKKLKAFLLKSGTRQGSPLLTPLSYTMLKILTVREEEEVKGIQRGKKKVKLSLFIGDMILSLKEPKHSTKKSLLTLINTFNKVAGFKIKVLKQ
jgi:hypothetical protein